ncbi:DUF3168 domain-containing protein [Roseovarius sp. LXJ103]|uniref:DUF3168 domain-containing protein n=1 Tax=Roseovarius carneus TaxID=2853164 RepID=UPI000D607A6F|nr:DUF3168 domain-containing protein [Roseovarius carneus]MBZ8118513.1 DUF3168 domain-containing protein [Roseovarius carneus]PWE35792.1 DUF3168 domain-containing protein [Pelagicola sp. LXJ1103]
MSYAASAALQAAVYQRLRDDPEVTLGVGAAIFDALPPGILPDTYVTLGPEEVRDRSDGTGGGAWHRFTISVVTQTAGFQSAKAIAAAIGDALVDADLSLSRGRLASLSFDRARARREGSGQLRRIDLTFRARVQDSA